MRPCSDLYLGRALSHHVLVAQDKKIITIGRCQRNKKRTDNLGWSRTGDQLVLIRKCRTFAVLNHGEDFEGKKIKIPPSYRQKKSILDEIRNGGAYAKGNFEQDMEPDKSYKTRRAPQSEFKPAQKYKKKTLGAAKTLSLSLGHIMSNPTTYYYFDKALENEECFSDEETVNGGEVGQVQRFTLQIRASSSVEVDEKIAECKKNLELELGVSSFLIPWDTKCNEYDKVGGTKDCPTKDNEKRIYFKNYKHFEACEVPKNVYIRLALRLMSANLDRDYLDDTCQSAINDFDSSPTGKWITNIRMTPCVSDSINPIIICLMINVPAEYENSRVLKQLLRKISGDRTVGLKFNTFSGAPKTLMDKLPSSDWTLKKVLQIEGEKQDAVASVKRIEAYFKHELLLGSKVQIVNTSRPRWATSPKGKRALREGMTTQIVLNDKLLCMDLDETNVFGKITKVENGKKITRYLLDILMTMKACKPVLVRGEMRRCPLFHSCCPKSGEETTFYYPEHCKQEAESFF